MWQESKQQTLGPDVTKDVPFESQGNSTLIQDSWSFFSGTNDSEH